MATSQQFSLRWNNYQSHITYAFDNLRSQDDFVDVTLCCDGRKIKAHKLLLSACSGYFKEIFKENPCPHPVIIFKFIKYEDLQAIIEFMYQGEVNVQQEALQSFLQTAELLSVQGLTSEEKDKPKSTKSPLEQRLIEEQLVKTLPATVRTVTTESNAQTQTQTIELQANIIQNSVRKRKLTFTEDDDSVYTETVEFVKEEEPTIVKTTEVQFIPATMKMDMPDYIQVPESSQLTTESHTQQAQQTSQDTTTQTTGQFASSYEILTDQATYESEMENKFSGNDETETGEMTSVEMDLPNGKWTECQFCKMVITTVNLWRHIRTQHTPQPPRKCDLCKKNFKNKYSLREHIRISHEQKQTKPQQ